MARHLTPIEGGLVAVGIVLLAVIAVCIVMFVRGAHVQAATNTNLDAVAAVAATTAIKAAATQSRVDLLTAVVSQMGTQLSSLTADTTTQLSGLDTRVSTLADDTSSAAKQLDTRVSSLAADDTRLNSEVTGLEARPRGTALVFGNNGAATCPTFCNNPYRKNADGTESGMWNLFDQVPAMSTWRGATSFRKFPQSGFCDCVEDPATPYFSLPLAAPPSGADRAYSG